VPTPAAVFDYSLEIPTDVFKYLIGHASLVTSAKEIKTHTSVIELTADEDLFSDPPTASSIKAMSTDGHRATSLVGSAVGVPFKFLLPVSSVPSIMAFEAETVRIHDGSNLIALQCGGVEVSARKFSVNFPAVSSAFQTDFELKAVVEAKDLYTMLSNIQPFLDAESPDVTVSFNQTLVADTGSSKDEIDYVAHGELGRVFKTPHKYVLDFLNKLVGPVKIKLAKDNSRVLMESGDKKYLFTTKIR